MIDSVVAHLKADSTLSGLIAGRVSPMVRTSKGDAVTYHQIDDTDPTTLDLVKDVQTLEYQFEVFAKKHYVMLQADFPRRKSNALPEEQLNKNKALAEKYNRNGVFPFVVVMNAKGEVYGETSYKKLAPKEYINEMNSFIK